MFLMSRQIAMPSQLASGSPSSSCRRWRGRRSTESRAKVDLPVKRSIVLTATCFAMPSLLCVLRNSLAVPAVEVGAGLRSASVAATEVDGYFAGPWSQPVVVSDTVVLAAAWLTGLLRSIHWLYCICYLGLRAQFARVPVFTYQLAPAFVVFAVVSDVERCPQRSEAVSHRLWKSTCRL